MVTRGKELRNGEKDEERSWGEEPKDDWGGGAYELCRDVKTKRGTRGREKENQREMVERRMKVLMEVNGKGLNE